MPIAVERKPATYHGRVQWYASCWSTLQIAIFDTKKQATSHAQSLQKKNPEGIVCVDWIPYGQSCRDVSRKSAVTDKRLYPVY